MVATFLINSLTDKIIPYGYVPSPVINLVLRLERGFPERVGVSNLAGTLARGGFNGLHP